MNENQFVLTGFFTTTETIAGSPPFPLNESGTIALNQPNLTPEPSTAILYLTGIGLMILTRKRIANLLRPAPGTHGSLSPH
jgi:hypothetical protein